MIGGLRYAGFCLLFGLGLCGLQSVPVFAGEYTLDTDFFAEASPSDSDYLDEVEIPLEEDMLDVEYEGSIDDMDVDVATPSDFPVLYSGYDGVYNGSISSTVLQLFRDTVEKLPPGCHYVMFRESQYAYRLVYSENLEYSDGMFYADSAFYVRYNSDYNNTYWTYGEEGRFSLTPGSYVVYSDLGEVYPVLIGGVRHYEMETLLFLLTVCLLISILHSFFSVGSYRI